MTAPMPDPRTPSRAHSITPALTLAATVHRSTGLSTGAIVIAVIAALVALACASWALARHRAFEPHWLLTLRHSVAEAGFRASETWAEFTDWIRIGH
jgi:hypothetical protein